MYEKVISFNTEIKDLHSIFLKDKELYLNADKAAMPFRMTCFEVFLDKKRSLNYSDFETLKEDSGLLKEFETIPFPDDEAKVLNAEEEEFVVLWRGTSNVEAVKQQGSAGGYLVNKDVEKPTRKQAELQVQGEKKIFYLAEFTTDVAVAEGFSYPGNLLVVKIQKKYLTKGSSVEGGWICHSSAPIDILAIIQRKFNHKNVT